MISRYVRPPRRGDTTPESWRQYVYLDSKKLYLFFCYMNVFISFLSICFEHVLGANSSATIVLLGGASPSNPNMLRNQTMFAEPNMLRSHLRSRTCLRSRTKRLRTRYSSGKVLRNYKIEGAQTFGEFLSTFHEFCAFC